MDCRIYNGWIGCCHIVYFGRVDDSMLELRKGMTKTTSKPRPGRYDAKKKKAAKLPPHTQRCKGCGVLLSQNRSIQDHEMFCEQAQDRNELTPIRDIDFVRGDLRGGSFARSH